MRRILGELPIGAKFLQPNGVYLTVETVNDSIDIPGYVEVVSEDDCFVAPIDLDVLVMACVHCFNEPATIPDLVQPKGLLGGERRLCEGCMEKLNLERRFEATILSTPPGIWSYYGKSAQGE